MSDPQLELIRVAAMCRVMNSKHKRFIAPATDNLKNNIWIAIDTKKGRKLFHIDCGLDYNLKQCARWFDMPELLECLEYYKSEEGQALYQLELLAGGVDV